MRVLIYLLMVLLSVGVVSALNCSVYSDDYRPYESLDYVCDGVMSDTCYTLIYYENATRGLINARPHVQFGEGFLKPIVRLFSPPLVAVSGFSAVNNVSIVQFSTKGLKPEYSYNFEVRCGTDVHAFNSSLLWKEPTSLVRGGFYLRDNAYLIFVLLLLFVVVVIFGLWLYNKVRYGK